MARFGRWESYTDMDRDEYLEHHLADAMDAIPAIKYRDRAEHIFSKLFAQAYNKGFYDASFPKSRGKREGV